MTAEISRGRKFPQVLAGARRIFLRDGFDGASVDDIASEAGVSKATLYSYFPDKRQMFNEVFRAELADSAIEGAEFATLDEPVETILRMMAAFLGGLMTSEAGVTMFRLAVGEAGRFPILAQEYYESGPIEARRQLMDYFRRCVGRGELAIEDFELAADQFIELCSTTVMDRAVLLGARTVDNGVRERIAHEAVRTFLARFGAPPR